MIKKLSVKQRELIKKWIREAKKALHLGDSSIGLRFYNTLGDSDYATTSTNITYLNATIKISEKLISELWDEFGEEEARKIVFHEVSHIFLAPVVVRAENRFISYDDFNNAHELLTEKLSFVLDDLLYNK